MDTTDKKSRRMSGLALRVAARLIETPGPNRLLYQAATHQLGLSHLHEIDIPTEIAPYAPLHLGTRESDGGRHG